MSAVNNEHDKNVYFEYGNVRIVNKEHFSEKGKSFDDIIEESIVRQARNENRTFLLQTNNTGEEL
ncbi:MAG: hypothetical protein K6F00_09315 [Lachnospiraceae bacterium]|nr:hypothetical protein [Lachnospiraceae bacterium]